MIFLSGQWSKEDPVTQPVHEVKTCAVQSGHSRTCAASVLVIEK